MSEEILNREELEYYTSRVPTWNCCGMQKDELARTALHYMDRAEVQAAEIARYEADIAEMRQIAFMLGKEDARDLLKAKDAEIAKRKWRPIRDRGLPEERDRYYLFGGYTDQGEWVCDKYHLSLDGLVNGWGPLGMHGNGLTHWMPLPEGPGHD